jgi:hypothetical protein
MTSRNKPGVAFWTTVGLVVVLVGYPLSFGPAAKIAQLAGAHWMMLPYDPIALLADSKTVGPIIVSYMGMWGFSFD